MAKLRKVICQKTGAYCRPEDLVRDGYTNLMVAKWNYDPPEPPVQKQSNIILKKTPDYCENVYQDVITFPTLNTSTMTLNNNLTMRFSYGRITGYFTLPSGLPASGVGFFGVGVLGVGGLDTTTEVVEF